MSSFQIKIVDDFCNLRCTYCRNRDFDQATKKVMSCETLGKILEVFSKLPQSHIKLNWHGGEPLLAGKSFFRHVVMFEREFPEKKWINSVQTNATLIDREWAQFFQDNNFSVGVSIDGDEETHDVNRINASGKGSYRAAIAGVKTLRDHGVNPGVICTVTKRTAAYGRKMFLGLIGAKFSGIAFNPFFNTASVSSEDEFGLSPDEWLKFQIDVFESWLSLNDPTIRVREIDAVLAWTKAKVKRNCAYDGSCSNWLTIDALGSVYPCARLGMEPRFGNLCSVSSFSEITESSDFSDWRSSIEDMPQKCTSCNFRQLCNNGCVSHRRAAKDGAPLYAYCESRLNFYDYVRRRIQLKGGGTVVSTDQCGSSCHGERGTCGSICQD